MSALKVKVVPVGWISFPAVSSHADSYTYTCKQKWKWPLTPTVFLLCFYFLLFIYLLTFARVSQCVGSDQVKRMPVDMLIFFLSFVQRMNNGVNIHQLCTRDSYPCTCHSESQVSTITHSHSCIARCCLLNAASASE